MAVALTEKVKTEEIAFVSLLTSVSCSESAA